VVVMDRARYAELFADRYVNRFQVRIGSGADAEVTRAAIARLWPARAGVRVMLNGEMKRRLLDSVRRSFAAVRTVQSVALFIAVIGLFSALLVSVLDRTSQLGCLRAIGATSGQLAG